MDPLWPPEMDQVLELFRVRLLERFDVLSIPPSIRPQAAGFFLAAYETALRMVRANEIISERHRDSICTYTQPPPGRSDAASHISHSSDSMGIGQGSEMNSAELEKRRLLLEKLNDPSTPDKMKIVITLYKDAFASQLIRETPEFSNLLTSAQRSYAGMPGSSKRQTSEKQSNEGMPGSSKRQTSEEQSDEGMPGSSRRQTIEEQSDEGIPGSSKRQTSEARETSDSGNFFQQERLSSTDPSARVDDRAESTSHPREEERLVDSLEHTSRSKPSPVRKPEARYPVISRYHIEISSERWREHIQRVEWAESPRSTSLRPDSQPPLEVSVSSNLQIDPETPEQKAERIERARRWLLRSERQMEEIIDECRIFGEAMEGLEARIQESVRQCGQQTRAMEARLEERTRESRALLARFGPTPSTATEPAKQKETKQLDPKDQPGTSGLRRSPRLMAQKRQTPIPESEGSNPKSARRESDSDTDSDNDKSDKS